jgi:hypothetical protein
MLPTRQYKFEVYDDGAAGWAWAGVYEGRTLVLSTNHPSEFAARIDIDNFKRRIDGKNRKNSETNTGESGDGGRSEEGSGRRP